MTVLGRIAGWIRDAISAVTPGQRWTSALSLAIATAVVSFGLPPLQQPVVQRPATTPAAPIAAPPTVADPSPPAPPAPSPPLFGTTPPRPATQQPPPAPPPPTAPAPPPEPGVTVPTLVLLASSEGTPGRTDADIARAIAADRGMDAEVVTGELHDAAVCDRAAGRDRLVVSSLGVAPAVRDCLIASGAVPLGYDVSGTSLERDGPLAISTAQGVVSALVDLATWLGSSDGPIGLVSTQELEVAVAPALGAVEEAGLRFDRTAYVADGPEGEPDVSSAVLEFASAGIATVVFAAPVEVQRSWTLKAGLVAPMTRYVVADVTDAVLDETYPPTFDGAEVRTVLRFPWSTRDGEEPTTRARCREVWEAAAPPGVPDPLETARALAWCQHLDLATALRAAATAGTAIREYLAETSVPSLLTSDLIPSDTTWGPTEPVTLRWSAACACWSQHRTETADIAVVG
ncbi:MAG: hypothetical protein KY469_13145 [Actinobacteria bacterium]|nr:hypothetical protein [Actinomycetota bacterium]